MKLVYFWRNKIQGKFFFYFKKDAIEFSHPNNPFIMSDNDSQNAQSTFANFMKPKSNEENKGSNYVIGANKTKESLKKSRDDKEEEKKKELLEAKKNSAALASRYNKSDMTKLQAKNIVAVIPFIALGVFIVLVVLFKGGDWLSKGLNTIFKIMTNG